jgi:hypothetical protein
MMIHKGRYPGARNQRAHTASNAKSMNNNGQASLRVQFAQAGSKSAAAVALDPHGSSSGDLRSPVYRVRTRIGYLATITSHLGARLFRQGRDSPTSTGIRAQDARLPGPSSIPAACRHSR